MFLADCNYCNNTKDYDISVWIILLENLIQTFLANLHFETHDTTSL